MRISKKDREIVFKKYNGHCSYCGDPLQKGWHIDQIEPLVRNWWDGTSNNPKNHTLENFNPSCPSCNIQKSSLSIEEFRKKIATFIPSLNSYSNQYKIAKKYNLVKETKAKVVFYYEQFIVDPNQTSIPFNDGN